MPAPTVPRGREATNPAASSLDLLQQIADEVRPTDASLEEWYLGYADTHRRRLAFDLDLVSSVIAADAHVLEVGSVPPLFTGAMKRSGFDIEGVDLNPERFGEAITRLGLTVAACDIEREPLPFNDGSFDAVVFFEIFEHLRINPISTMREVHRVLRPSGQLLLSTPNLRSFNGLFNFLLRNKSYSCTSDVYSQYEKLDTLGHMGHVREYTSREVVEFLARIGFESTRIIYRGGYDDAVRRIVTAVVPTLRPFVTVVAQKVA